MDGLLDWSQPNASGSPSGSSGVSLAYDSTRQKTVAFGGASIGVKNDTSEWDGTNWITRAVSGPRARLFGGMSYDSGRRRIVLFGGAVQDSVVGTLGSITPLGKSAARIPNAPPHTVWTAFAAERLAAASARAATPLRTSPAVAPSSIALTRTPAQEQGAAAPPASAVGSQGTPVRPGPIAHRAIAPTASAATPLVLTRATCAPLRWAPPPTAPAPPRLRATTLVPRAGRMRVPEPAVRVVPPTAIRTGCARRPTTAQRV